MEIGILEGRIYGKSVVDVEGEGLKVVEGRKVEKSRFSAWGREGEEWYTENEIVINHYVEWGVGSYLI
jgi:hypothetical protein